MLFGVRLPSFEGGNRRLAELDPLGSTLVLLLGHQRVQLDPRECVKDGWETVAAGRSVGLPKDLRQCPRAEKRGEAS